MQKNEKYASRALKRINSEVFWTKSHWEWSIWNFIIFGCVLARFGYPPLKQFSKIF